MDGIPFLELWPEYRQELICNLILKLWAPEMSKTITMGDGLFLMICDPVKDMVTNRFIQLLSEQAVNEGIPVDISYETDTNAPLDQIISRYI